MKKLSEEKLLQERERLSAMRKHEEALLRQGYRYVIGVDEAGRGPLCGPVAAAACILPPDCEILFLNDSKKLSEKKRELLFDEIREKALAYGIGLAEPARIDEINILNATFEAMRSAVDRCRQMLTGKLQESDIPEADPSIIVLVDGNKEIPGLPLPEESIIKGDANSLSIAAASILAKTYRDDYMNRLAAEYPAYQWEQNKGYPTRAHREAIRLHGISPYHRKTFTLLPEQLELSFCQE